jgi:glycine cleavage system aminomethyltransferase T
VLSPALARPVALGYVHRDFTDAQTAVTIAHGNRVVNATVSSLPFISRAAG